MAELLECQTLTVREIFANKGSINTVRVRDRVTAPRCFVDGRFSSNQAPLTFVFGAVDTWVNIFTGPSAVLTHTETGFDTVGDSGIWTYTGALAADFMITGNISLTGDGVPGWIFISVFVNGSMVLSTDEMQRVESGSTRGNGQVSTSAVVTLEPEDTVEIRILNGSSDDNMLAHSARMVVYFLAL